LGAARQDDQRISKSRFDATDIVRVAAFDRTLLQLDFGSIASSAEALEVRMLPACRVGSLDGVGPLVILPAFGALEQFR
jgi:hypothetical protein